MIYYYNREGKDKFRTSSFIASKTLQVSATGCSATNNTTLYTFPKGSILMTFRGRVRTLFACTGSGTLQLGVTGNASNFITTAIAKASITTVGVIVGPSTSFSATKGSMFGKVLTADAAFKWINATAKLTAGKMDIEIFYIPPPEGNGDASIIETKALT
jgi:hypothetical protein